MGHLNLEAMVGTNWSTRSSTMSASSAGSPRASRTMAILLGQRNHLVPYSQPRCKAGLRKGQVAWPYRNNLCYPEEKGKEGVLEQSRNVRIQMQTTYPPEDMFPWNRRQQMLLLIFVWLLPACEQDTLLHCGSFDFTTKLWTVDIRHFLRNISEAQM